MNNDELELDTFDKIVDTLISEHEYFIANEVKKFSGEPLMSPERFFTILIASCFLQYLNLTQNADKSSLDKLIKVALASIQTIKGKNEKPV